jgi:type I restriction enzyme M protein
MAKLTEPNRELFSFASTLPEELPTIGTLAACPNLEKVLDRCHNYIFANEGLSKDKVFLELLKLMVCKLHDERRDNSEVVRFGISRREFQQTLKGGGSPFSERLAALFTEAVEHHRGVFASTERLGLKPLTTAHVVGELQHHSLDKTPGDVKGRAFQAVVGRSTRGDRGEYFTPAPVVSLAVETLGPRPGERIIDPACGSGGFLIEVIKHWKRTALQSGDSLADSIKAGLRGVEFNPDVARSAWIRLRLEGGDGDEIRCRDALSLPSTEFGTYDVVLTNPPFGSRCKVSDPELLRPYDLAHKWVEAESGEFSKQASLAPQSPEILFTELCIRLLRPGGRLAIVLPDGLLQNSSSRFLRAWIRARCHVDAVFSLPQETFIPYGTGIKTSLLLLRRHMETNDEAPPAFMGRLSKVGYDVKGQPLLVLDAAGAPQVDRFGDQVLQTDVGTAAESYRTARGGAILPASDEWFTVSASDLNGRLDVEHYLPGDRSFLKAQRSESRVTTLGDVADIVRARSGFRKLGPDAEIEYIAISDLDARNLRITRSNTLKVSEAPSRATFELLEGDILTSVAGASIGSSKHASAYVGPEYAGAICSNGLAVLRDVHGIEVGYLLAFLQSSAFLRQVRRLRTGHAIPALSLDDLRQIVVPLPSKAEQREIAELIWKARELQDSAASLIQKACSRTALQSPSSDS